MISRDARRLHSESLKTISPAIASETPDDQFAGFLRTREIWLRLSRNLTISSSLAFGASAVVSETLSVRDIHFPNHLEGG